MDKTDVIPDILPISESRRTWIGCDHAEDVVTVLTGRRRVVEAIRQRIPADRREDRQVRYDGGTILWAITLPAAACGALIQTCVEKGHPAPSRRPPRCGTRSRRNQGRS